MQKSFYKIPDSFIVKWQEIADLLANIMNISAALIMKVENEFMEVFISSKNQDNPYDVGAKKHWQGLYCETVIKTQQKLHIPNALKDEFWKKNVDVKLGMIAYLGIPLNFPNNEPFGTLCVLNNKEKNFTDVNEKLLYQIKNVIELDLALIESLNLSENAHDADIIQKLVKYNEELTKANQKSEENNKRLQSIFRVAPTCIGLVKNRQLIEVNEFICKLLGYSKEELIGQDSFLIHPSIDEYEFVEREKYNQIQLYGTGLVETQWKKKTGEIVDILLSSTPIDLDDLSKGITFTAIDITERKKNEKELVTAKICAEQSEQRFKSLIENAPDGIAIIDLSGNFLYASPNASRHFGYNEDEFLGHAGNEFTFAEDMPLILKTIETILLNPAAKPQIKYRFQHKSGKYSWIETTFTNLLSDEAVNGIVLNFTDITEREQIMNELIIAKHKAEENDGLKTAFLQNLSHEIRTPLNAICGFSVLLTKPALTAKKQKNFVTIIQNSSNQLLSIVSDILTISSLETKQEKISINNVCINTLIIDLLTIFKQQAFKQNITLSANYPLNNQNAEIYTDQTKLTQILSNLIANALKFTYKGNVEFGYSLNERELEFYVKDSGIGIKKDLHDKIFERFRQADLPNNNSFGGIGLGLSISKGFVELLGGKIWVESEINQGATFYFTIPYKPVNSNALPHQILSEINSKPVILVAEDEEFNFLYIEHLLEDFNYTLIHTKNGQETIDIVESNPNVSLILMDIKMPVMSGDDAAKIIKEKHTNLPIIAQTAYAMEYEIEKYRAIFDDYLTKPIDENMLVKYVMKYIKEK